MRNLEFFRNVSIGQYVDGDSPVHRASPSSKFLWLFAVLLPASVVPQAAVVGILALTCLGFALLARVGLGFLLRGFLPVLPLLAIAAALQVAFTWAGDPSPRLLTLGPLSITAAEAATVGSMALRFFTMVLGIALFTSVITEGDTARGIEDVLSPLARVGFPAHELSLAVAVAFRFIPIVAGEMESIVKAQAVRGADFGRGRGGPLRKARAYLPLLVPVTLRALERAEALAEAMEARCYVARGRTRYVETAGGRGDAFVKAAALLYGTAVLAASAVL